MPAYIIVDVTITNPTEYEAYKQLTPASLTAYQGKFIVRGAVAETLEGSWQPGRLKGKCQYSYCNTPPV